MRDEADIIYEIPHRLLLVECTGMNESSLAKAAEHRDCLRPFWSSQPEYFMLVLRMELHLWRKDAPAGSLPQFTASPQQIWRDYLGKLADQPGTLRSECMELAVDGWLGDLAYKIARPNSGSEADQLLVSSGLYDQLKSGARRYFPE